MVGEDGILSLHTTQSSIASSDSPLNTTTDFPSDLALAAIECSLTPRKKRRYNELYNFNMQSNYPTCLAWSRLKQKMNFPINSDLGFRQRLYDIQHTESTNRF